MALQYYALLNRYTVTLPPKKSKTKEEQLIISDAKEISLCEYSSTTRDIITAHRIQDYRKKSFCMTLLPNKTIMFDFCLKELGII